MGFVMPGFAAASSGPSFTLLSFNINSEFEGPETILRHIDAIKPDLVLFQEATWGGPMEAALKTRFPYTDSSTQFVIGSRYPILARTEPEKVPHQGKQRSPRFMRYVIDSPLGKLALYSLHPISPRGSMGIARFRGTLHRIRTGEIWAGDPESDVIANASLRVAQVHYAAKMAGQESMPVLLAGDTNLPGASATLRRELGQYSDAFRDAGWGFGYTYPAKHPWLRLDRVMASAALKFSQFRVGCPAASDHLCVSVQVSKR
jgi:endonuclease/exonuclease/phosphatase (EEP) superfamily protein YafD